MTHSIATLLRAADSLRLQLGCVATMSVRLHRIRSLNGVQIRASEHLHAGPARQQLREVAPVEHHELPVRRPRRVDLRRSATPHTELNAAMVYSSSSDLVPHSPSYQRSVAWTSACVNVAGRGRHQEVRPPQELPEQTAMCDMV